MSARPRQPGDKLRDSLREAQVILDDDQAHPATWRLVATILLTALRLEASRAGQTIAPTKHVRRPRAGPGCERHEQPV